MEYKNCYVFCGLLAFGIIATVYSNPVPEDRSQTNGNGDTPQNDQTDEYDYEDRNSPGDQIKSTASSPKSTLLPYFDSKIVRKTVKPGGNITLECPVKNLEDTNVILWFKEKNIITNNLNVLDNAYELAKQNFSLIIKNATVSFEGNFYCEIAPQKIRMQTILKVSNETTPITTSPPEPAGPTVGAGASEITAMVSLVLLSLFMSNLLSTQECFRSLLSY